MQSDSRLCQGVDARGRALLASLASEAYEARCRRCHDVPSDQRYQTSLLDLLGSTPADPVVLTRESLTRRV